MRKEGFLFDRTNVLFNKIIHHTCNPLSNRHLLPKLIPIRAWLRRLSENGSELARFDWSTSVIFTKKKKKSSFRYNYRIVVLETIQFIYLPSTWANPIRSQRKRYRKRTVVWGRVPCPGRRHRPDQGTERCCRLRVL